MSDDKGRTTSGREGERLAARFLRRQGCKILQRNCRSKLGEIDLIVRDGEEVVFVEVKTRVGASGGPPETAVGARQRGRIARAAQAFATRHRLRGRTLRFDVVVVLHAKEGEPEIVHYRDAFTI